MKANPKIDYTCVKNSPYDLRKFDEFQTPLQKQTN